MDDFLKKTQARKVEQRKTMYPGEIEVEVYGHSNALFFDPKQTGCGKTDDGVCFRFGDERGGWVVPLAELKRLVALAEAARAESWK